MNSRGILRCIAVLSVLALAVSPLFAAGQQGTDAAASEEKLELSIFWSIHKPFPPDVDEDDNPWANVFKEAFPDVEIDWIFAPGNSFEQKKNVLMGSGDFPDVTSANQSQMIKWADQGIIVPLGDLATDMPNWAAHRDEEVISNLVKSVTYKDEVWAIPSISYRFQNPWGFWIRDDWLDNLNLERPTTIDELYDVMHAFTYADPDGNGKDDTFGMVSYKNLRYGQNISIAFDAAEWDNKVYWTWEDDELLPDFVRPEMKEALAFFRRLYADGIMDKDSLAYNSGSTIVENAIQGRYGIIDFWSGAFPCRINNGITGGPEDPFHFMGPVEGPNGHFQMVDWTSTGGGIIVTQACENPGKVKEIIDWLYAFNEDTPYIDTNSDMINASPRLEESPIAQIVSHEGKQFVTVNRAALQGDYSHLQYHYNYRLAMGFMHMADGEMKAALTAAQKADGNCGGWLAPAFAAAEEHVKYSGLLVTPPLVAERMPDLQTYYDEIKMKIVTGDEPLSAYDEWVEYFYDNGGQELIDAATEMNSK